MKVSEVDEAVNLYVGVIGKNQVGRARRFLHQKKTLSNNIDSMFLKRFNVWSPKYF